VLPRDLLLRGLVFEGRRVPLLSPQGIFRPRIAELPLTITTSPNSPYDDAFSEDEYLRYRYRGTDPAHRDNVGLRRLMQAGRPLIYFHGIVPGRYLAVWPAYIVGDDPAGLTFSVAVDDVASIRIGVQATRPMAEGAEARCVYLTTTVRARMHQRGFRERVIEAYRSQCAFCRLRHRELLDAAHIIPDQAEMGEPVVSNGIALCKLYHAAFDSFMLGVRPDYVIEVRADILHEEDGPLRLHSLQDLHQTRMILPASRDQWPSPDSLAWKYDRILSGP
jgi:putative restriction endonuclease